MLLTLVHAQLRSRQDCLDEDLSRSSSKNTHIPGEAMGEPAAFIAFGEQLMIDCRENPYLVLDCHDTGLKWMPLHECCDTTTPESIHTKDESKCNSAFAFIFGVN